MLKQTMLDELTRLLAGQPQLLIMIDLLAKSLLVTGCALLASRWLGSRVNSVNLHRYWVGTAAMLLLIPLLMLIRSMTAVADSYGTSLISLAMTTEPLTESLTAARFRFTWSDLLLMLYVVPGACLGASLLASLASVYRLTGRARVVADDRARDCLQQTVARFGVSRRVVIRESAEIQSPFSFGLLAPQIVLPVSARGWTDVALEDVLIHEVCHIRRLDWLWTLLCRIVVCCYWINPLCWQVVRKVAQESEFCCDQSVLSAGKDGARYAGHLLQIARSNRHRTRFPVQQVVAQHSLKERINRILEAPMQGTTGKKFASLTTAAAVLTMTLFANLQLVSSSAQQPASRQEMLPLLTPTPQYPTQAAADGTEGWVHVSFTVDAEGGVPADSIKIVDQEPPEVFGRSALVAARDFKFEPRKENGVAVSVPNVQFVFWYALEEREPYPFAEDYAGRLPPGFGN